jgi:hypothetical protein
MRLDSIWTFFKANKNENFSDIFKGSAWCSADVRQYVFLRRHFVHGGL